MPPIRYLISVLLLLTLLTACKSYEKAGGINYLSRFNTCEQDLPVFTRMHHLSNDSSEILIHIHFTEYNNQKNLPRTIQLQSVLDIDKSNNDKFSFPPIIEQNKSSYTLHTLSDTTIHFTFPLSRNEKGWYRFKMFTSDSVINIKRIEPFDKEDLNDISFYAVTDSNGQLVHPSYLHTSTLYYIDHLNQNESFIVTRYPYHHTPASPIFFSKANLGLPAEQDTSITIKSNESFNSPVAAYYFLQRFNDSTGAPLLVHHNNFPELETAEDLIEPLRYISRNEEYKKLLNASDYKAQLDSFWMSHAMDMNNAKRSIQLYYSRVEFANRHFTTYKAGWKTDPGLVYIMFGKPQKCYKFKAGEIWSYTNLPSQTEFVFMERKHPFCKSFLELRRENEYLNIWNMQSFKWRSGKMVNE